MMKWNQFSSVFAALAGAAMLQMSTGAAAADLKRGELLFQTCSACHNPLGGGMGPDLTGIYGRKAATLRGFNYSGSMRESGLVWNEANLRAFIMDPRALVKGTTMSFPGYSKKSDVDDVLAYLRTVR